MRGFLQGNCEVLCDSRIILSNLDLYNISIKFRCWFCIPYVHMNTAEPSLSLLFVTQIK